MRSKPIVVKRSVLVRGRNTSVTLENEFWEAFKLIADLRGLTLTALVELIDAARGSANLSSAIRVAVLKHYRERAHRAVKRRRANKSRTPRQHRK